MPVILAIANQKGGTGKTTTAAALAEGLRHGRRVLLVDMDPQSSLTQSLGIDNHGAGLADVIGGAQRGSMAIRQVIKPAFAGVDLAPANIALAACELGIVSRMGRESILKQALHPLEGYDVIIIDCAPSLGLLTVNALTAARAVIVPTLPSAADLRGVHLFLDTLAGMREINPALELLGVLIVQYDPRLIAHGEALRAIHAADLPILGTIPRSVRAQEAGAAKEPVTTYAPDSTPAQAYKSFTKGITQWLRKQSPA
jgi:chromosome partitioning protein